MIISQNSIWAYVSSHFPLNSNITDIAPMTRLRHQPQHCAMFITQQQHNWYCTND